MPGGPRCKHIQVKSTTRPDANLPLPCLLQVLCTSLGDYLDAQLTTSRTDLEASVQRQLAPISSSLKDLATGLSGLREEVSDAQTRQAVRLDDLEKTRRLMEPLLELVPRLKTVLTTDEAQEKHEQVLTFLLEHGQVRSWIYEVSLRHLTVLVSS